MAIRNLQAYRATEQKWWDECGIMPREHIIPVPEYRIKVRVLETGRGQPAVFTHGSPSGASAWAPLAARMSDVRCLLLDRPGCGLSECPDYRTFSQPDLQALSVAVIDAVLDAFDLKQTALIGNSYGGAWTLWYTAARPERVARIVLDGAPAFVEGMSMGQWKLFQLPLVPQIVAGMKITEKSQRANFIQMGHGPSVGAGIFSDTFWEFGASLFNDAGTWQNEIGGMFPVLMRKGGPARLTFTPDFLRRIAQPALVLWGEHDNFASPLAGQRMVAAMPNAIFKLFQGGGHLPWLDEPEQHAKLIRAFLAQEHALEAHEYTSAVLV